MLCSFGTSTVWLILSHHVHGHVHAISQIEVGSQCLPAPAQFHFYHPSTVNATSHPRLSFFLLSSLFLQLIIERLIVTKKESLHGWDRGYL